MLLSFFAFNAINNLRAFNVTFSSIPTAPTKVLLSLLPLPPENPGLGRKRP